MKWISVKDELPSKEIKIMIIRTFTTAKPPVGFFKGTPEEENIMVAVWRYREFFIKEEDKEEENKCIKTYKKEWGFFEDDNLIENITHYMPLPKFNNEKGQQ